MSHDNDLPPALTPDGALWQLLKAYANEDWDWATSPWPAPAEAFLSDSAPALARALKAELTDLGAWNDARWQAALEVLDADWRSFAPDARFSAWAQALHDLTDHYA